MNRDRQWMFFPFTSLEEKKNKNNNSHVRCVHQRLSIRMLYRLWVCVCVCVVYTTRSIHDRAVGNGTMCLFVILSHLARVSPLTNLSLSLARSLFSDFLSFSLLLSAWYTYSTTHIQRQCVARHTKHSHNERTALARTYTDTDAPEHIHISHIDSIFSERIRV